MKNLRATAVCFKEKILKLKTGLTTRYLVMVAAEGPSAA